MHISAVKMTMNLEINWVLVEDIQLLESPIPTPTPTTTTTSQKASSGDILGTKRAQLFRREI